jgi:formylglycine-generating enzyme required for sulfatase activity
MPVLFISHSTKDDAVASALEAWLHANGCNDIFIDHHSIAGGDKWRDALRMSAGACRAVICVVSENWLASDECWNEFGAAWYMGKRIIPLFLVRDPALLANGARERLAKIYAEDQGLDILPCLDSGGLLRLDSCPEAASSLKLGLRAAGAVGRIGLDPEAFVIDARLRPVPFPGLASFGDDDADAALFYGRSGDIARVLEQLRKMRADMDLRPLAILGASGAGKSSLLRAGVIPRLRREAPAWLPLRAFRPGGDPLLNFAEALARTLADFGKVEAHGVIRDRLLDVWSKAERKKSELTPTGRARIAAVIEAEGSGLRDAAGRSGATILISVDQAEELARAEGNGGDALADYLRVASAEFKGQWRIALTIRVDSFSELQSHPRFESLDCCGYDLRAISVNHFIEVVQEPARRYKVEVDHDLLDALMADAPKEDALPLLAFVLQHLWRQYAATGILTKKNYDTIGGLTGLIEDAAERALRGLEPGRDEPMPSAQPAKRLTDLAAATFVPALAQINDQGAAIRRVAKWTTFGAEQQELLKRFDRWRLVVRKGEDSGTVELAHEALLRNWARLKPWLEPERARLEALRLLQLVAATWDRNGRDQAFLNHKERRLHEANALAAHPRYREYVGKLESDYLAACEKAEELARQDRRRLQAVVAVLLIAIIGAFAWSKRDYVAARVVALAEMIRPKVLTGEAERALMPGDRFKECAHCPEMVVLPAGRFMMGSPSDEKGRLNDEGPRHQVVIGKPFAVSRFEVTFEEWDACWTLGGCDYLPSDQGWGRGRQPVINVSWEDAQRYVAWSSQRTGRTYRLLSEAEWEYAARAGSDKAYAWGDDIGKGNANCVDCESKWDGRQTAPVGSFAANAFGLYDMHGNVWEYVEDCYRGNYDNAPSDGTTLSTDGCSHSVVRGGSWLDDPQGLRSAYRQRILPDARVYYVGFRVARTL